MKVIALLRRMFDVEGFILVGGASSRMGSDKSQLKYSGKSAVEQIAAALESVVDAVRVVGAAGDRHLSRFQNVPDLHVKWGALGGIHAALTSCQSTWAFVIACDLPLVTTELLGRLRQLANASHDAVVPIQADGRPQPLCALFRRQECLAEAEKLISSGEHTPRALLARVRTRWVKFAEIADLAGAADILLNVNTPEDYEIARSIIERPT